MGKGSKRRPRQVTKDEEDLRWKLATGAITFSIFEKRYHQLLKEGKIVRSGRKIDNA